MEERSLTPGGPEGLADIWHGTLRLSTEVKRTRGSILIRSNNRFPIDPAVLDIGLLFILEKEESGLKKVLEMSQIGVPSHILYREEMDLLADLNPIKVLELTNDYIVIHGNPPLSINGMKVKSALKERMINGLSEALLKCRSKVKEGQGTTMVKYALGQSIVSAMDLHRLEGSNIRTRKSHLVNLFQDIPSSRDVILDSYSLLKGRDLSIGTDDLLDRYCDLVFIPLLERVRTNTCILPALPPARSDPECEEGGIFRSILTENRRIYSSLDILSSNEKEQEEGYEVLYGTEEDSGPSQGEDLEDMEIVGEVVGMDDEEG